MDAEYEERRQEPEASETARGDGIRGNVPITITGGTLTINVSQKKLKENDKGGGKFDYSHPDEGGQITRVRIRSGTGKERVDLDIPILKHMNTEIEIDYELP